jgi:hypothetical protein
MLILLLIDVLLVAGWAYGISLVMTRTNFLGGLIPNLNSNTPTQAATPSLPATLTPTSLPTASATIQPTGTPSPIPATATLQPIGTLALDQGLILMSLDEGGNNHLFI